MIAASASTSGPAATSIPVARGRSLIIVGAVDDYIFSSQSGIFALETYAGPPRRRILDFLLRGESISTRMLRGIGEVRLRAIEPGVLHRQSRAGWLETAHPATMTAMIEQAALRATIINLIAGLDDIDARVATFLVAIAARSGKAGEANAGRVIPIGREDVADHILINPDTLSRACSRLRAQHAIVKGQHNRLVIGDWERLAALSPLTAVIEAAFR